MAGAFRAWRSLSTAGVESGAWRSHFFSPFGMADTKAPPPHPGLLHPHPGGAFTELCKARILSGLFCKTYAAFADHITRTSSQAATASKETAADRKRRDPTGLLANWAAAVGEEKKAVGEEKKVANAKLAQAVAKLAQAVEEAAKAEAGSATPGYIAHMCGLELGAIATSREGGAARRTADAGTGSRRFCSC